MNNEQIISFPNEVAEKLNYYVYRLIDPSNGETFYVGKGKGNRVFAHALGNIHSDEEDEKSNKLERINKIKNSGLKVIHVIHRHGMDGSTALEVEAALIDATPGLTNIQGGTGSSDVGPMHVKEIIDLYSATPAIFPDTLKAIMINVNQSTSNENERLDFYNATRYAWRLDKNRANRADYVFSVVKGIIKAVFELEEWLEATNANFPGFPDVPGRFGFNGRKASDVISSEYLQKRVPDEYRKRGAANPIRYINI